MFRQRIKSILYSVVIVSACAFFVWTTIDPLWQSLGLHVPGELHSKVNFTQPVDSAFYVRNAEYGFHWSEKAYTSIAFHPFLVWAIRSIPIQVAANYRLWIISLLTALLVLPFLYEYTANISQRKPPVEMLFLIPILPGGIGLATGNAEFPCLLFTTLLMLSILQQKTWYLTSMFAILAILTKPNALYVVPTLTTYLAYHFPKTRFSNRVAEILSRLLKGDLDGGSKGRESFCVSSEHFCGVKEGETNHWIITRNSAAGLVSLILGWVCWILYVDIRSGGIGTYWSVRKFYTYPLSDGPFSLLKHTLRIFMQYSDIGEQLKYSSAIALPIIYISMLLFISMKAEVHRLSILAGFVSILVIAFYSNNPNKIVLYTTTFPGSFAVSILYVHQMFFERQPLFHRATTRFLFGGLFLLLCLFLFVFYIFGTPLAWYY